MDMSDDAFPFEPSDPLFSLGAITRITDIPMNRMRMWIARGYIELLGLRESQPALQQGKQHNFTFRNVMVVALMKELNALGVDLRPAFEAAEQWMAFGDLPGEMGAVARREPGGLFDPAEFMTLLVYSNTAPHVRMVAMKKDAGGRHAIGLNELFFRGERGSRVLFVNPIWHEIMTRAGAELTRKDGRSKRKPSVPGATGEGAVS